MKNAYKITSKMEGIIQTVIALTGGKLKNIDDGNNE